MPLEWLSYVPWVFTAIFFADKAIAALRRLVAAPAELRTNILLRAEKIHAEQMQERAETQLAARATEIIALIDEVEALKKMLAEALSWLRPNSGSSLHDKIVKFDQDLRAFMDDSIRWRREMMKSIESLSPPPIDPDSGASA